MIALGKTLAAGTLAFSTFATSMVPGWNGMQQAHYINNDKGDQEHRKNYTGDDWRTGHAFYKLSWDERNKLCNDDHYWLMWARYDDGDDKMRDKLCEQHRGGNDHASKDQDKKHVYDDRDDKRYESAYDLREAKQDYYSAQTEEKEKSSVDVAYANYNAADSRSQDYGYDKGGYDSWDHEDKGYGYNTSSSKSSEDQTEYKLAADYEKESKASVEAQTAQVTNINNYTYVYGDNNVVNNNISVANTASVTQSASTSETSNVAVKYNTASRESEESDKAYGYGDNSGYGSQGGYGSSDSSNSTSAESYKLAASSEKSSSSTVTQASSYTLDESYRSAENGYDQDKDDCYDKDEDYHAPKYEDCE